MGLFHKSVSLPALLQKVQQHQFTTTGELEETLQQIAASDELKPKLLLPLLGDTNPRIREWAGQTIATLSGGKVVPLLLDAMQGVAEPRVRQDLAKVIAKADLAEVYRAVGPMVHSKVAQQREVALDVIGAHPRWLEFFSLLKAAMKWPEPALRVRVARILRRGADHPTVRLMLLDLTHSDEDLVRKEVIGGLASTPAPDIVEPFFARLEHEPRDTQSIMVDALSKLAANSAVQLEERLLPILAHENPRLRDIAVRLLAEMPNRKQVLRSFLVHSRGVATWLRERTASSILMMTSDLVEPLLELMRDPEDDIKVGAMIMAADSKDPRVVPLVREIFLGDQDWWIRSIAADVLARYASPDVIETLLLRLGDPELLYSVVTALGRIGDPSVVPPLLACLADEARGVRMVTLEALRGRATREVAAAVLRCARDDQERRIQEKAAEILGTLGAFGEQFMAELAQHDERLARQRDSTVAVDLAMVNDTLNAAHAAKQAP